MRLMSRILLIGIALMMPALAVAQDLAQLEREATARAQAVAVSGGPSALATEIARELSAIGQYEDFFYVGEFAPALRNFPGETATAFRSVEVEIQYNLLLWSWKRFAFPGMTPVVRALYQSPPEDYSKMRDLALRRFYDLAPDEARPFMLEELQRTDLRVSMTTLARLGDVTFPEFEPLWLHNLEDGILDERVDAAVRIERFGSPAIRAEVRKLYDANAAAWSCDARSAVLGYLARVDKTGGAALVRQALNAPAQDGEDCRPAYLRSPPLRPQLLARAPLPAKPAIIVAGPVPGDESRIQYTIGDQVYRSTEELTTRLEQLPAGTTIAWTYQTGTAGTHAERWPASERDALFARVQRIASAKNIHLER
jgi:hypothetical protein